MATPTTGKNGTIVVSALRARAHFGKLLRRVDDERRSLIIEKRGTPKAVLLSIRDYVKLAAPEPEVLRVIGEESERNGTSTLTSRQIDQIIKTSRSPEAEAINASLISAAIKPAGLQRTVLLLAITRPARLYVSRPILEEYSEVLGRRELRIRKGLRQQLLQLIKNHSYTVVPTRRLHVTSDPDDNMFLECADAARADYLVTGNQKHFPRFWKKTKIITTREFISLTAPHLIK